VPSLRLCLRPSPVTSHALLAQTSRQRMTSVGCRHPQRIYVFTRIFGWCKPIYLCHSDPTNSQATLHIISSVVIHIAHLCINVSPLSSQLDSLTCIQLVQFYLPYWPTRFQLQWSSIEYRISIYRGRFARREYQKSNRTEANTTTALR